MLKRRDLSPFHISRDRQPVFQISSYGFATYGACIEKVDKYINNISNTHILSCSGPSDSIRKGVQNEERRREMRAKKGEGTGERGRMANK